MEKTISGAAAPVNAGFYGDFLASGSGRAARYRLRVGGVSVLLERSHAEMLALCRLLFAAGRPAIAMAGAEGVAI